MSNTIAQIKRNFYRVREICENINSLMDKGFLIFNADHELQDSKYRFEFVEPDWNSLTIEHVWFDEVTKKEAENTTYGYFNPDESLKETIEFWKLWKAVPKDSYMSVLPWLEKRHLKT